MKQRKPDDAARERVASILSPFYTENETWEKLAKQQPPASAPGAA